MIADAATGHGPRVVLVTGPSGIGKSALLAEAAHQADVPVLSAEAFAPDQNEAWSLASGILRGPPGAAFASLDEQDRRAFGLQGAVRLIAAMARPRCLLAIDDLQWADPTSLTLLGLLLRRLDGVSLVTAYRPDGSPGLDPAEALGWPASQMTGITLGPLPAGVIRGLFSDLPLAEAILRQADRTPFTVTEVIAALDRQGAISHDTDGTWRLRPARDAAGAESIVAAGIAQAAENRLAGLPSRWRDMLRSAAPM